MGLNSNGENKTSLARRFAKNGIALAIGGLVSQVAFIFIEVLVARGLGAAAYGIFATTYALIILAAFVFDFGTTWWTIQEGSRRQEMLPALLGNSLLMKTIAFFSLYIAAAVIVTFSPLPIEVKVFAAIFGFYALGLSWVDSIAAVFTARQEMHFNAVFQALSPIAILIIYLVVIRNGIELGDVAVSYVLGSFGVAFLWLVCLPNSLRPTASLADALRLTRQSYHYGFSGVLRQVFNKTDVIMVAFIAGPAEAGIYAAAVKFLDLFYKIPVLFGRVVSPALFVESQGQFTPKFYDLISGYSRLLVSIGALASLTTFLAADQLVNFVFGSDFGASATILRVLSLVMIQKCMMTICESVLSSRARHTERWISMGAAVILNIVCNFALIPRFGGQGAAVATLLSSFILIILLVTLGFGRKLGKQALAWFGVPLLTAAALGVWIRSTDFELIIALPLALLALVVGLFATRIMTIHEIRRIGGLMSTKKDASL